MLLFARLTSSKVVGAYKSICFVVISDIKINFSEKTHRNAIQRKEPIT